MDRDDAIAWVPPPGWLPLPEPIEPARTWRAIWREALLARGSIQSGKFTKKKRKGNR